MPNLDLGIDLMSLMAESAKINLSPNPDLFCKSTTVTISYACNCINGKINTCIILYIDDCILYVFFLFITDQYI